MKIDLILDPTEFDLIDDVKNEHIYNQYSSPKYQYKKKILDLTEYAAIYQFKTEFFCLDSQIKRVTYYMKYEVNNNNVFGQFVWQSMVWSMGIVHKTYLNGIPHKIFFDYLLPKFHVILTDSQQTWKGRRFWEIAIGQAFHAGLNVYFFNFSNNELVKLQNVMELSKFQSKYDIWGNAPEHQKKRMVITNREL